MEGSLTLRGVGEARPMRRIDEGPSLGASEGITALMCVIRTVETPLSDVAASANGLNATSGRCVWSMRSRAWAMPGVLARPPAGRRKRRWQRLLPLP